MDEILGIHCATWCWTLTIAAVLAAAGFMMRRSKSGDKPSVERDTVILHQLPRGPKAPSISPFPIKLETFLRMHNIPYVNEFTKPFAKSTHKTPWIEYNGTVVADSQFCIEYLKKERGIPSDPHLTDSELAIARAFLKLTEENLYWCMCAVIFVDEPSYMRVTLPYTGLKFHVASRFLARVVRKEMHGHGIGRHSSEQISQIGESDLRAVSDFLGDKPYMMGDNPSEIDCAVFGILLQAVTHLEGSRLDLYMKELPNLGEFLTRMRERYWPDWDDCLAK